MTRDLLGRLEQWKGRFGPPETGGLERLLAAAARHRFRNAEDLIRLHETALFLRAYPRTPEVARLADAILFSFAERTAVLADLDAFEAPEISGIAGTSLSAVFSYEIARFLAARYPRRVEIAWDRYDGIDRMGPVLSRLLPLLDEDWAVEAHVPFREWISAARGSGSGLAWLLQRLERIPGPRERAAAYAALELPLTWRIGNVRASRSRLRLPVKKLYCHGEPLLRRSGLSLQQELEAPPLPVTRLPQPQARKMLDLVLDTSAMRYRELYGFSHPEEDRVFRADAGRGVEIFYFGAPPAWRLPLRAYHAGMFFKNGVPAGYVELLSLFERAEVGFNLYYTFREGESAWIYARLLRLFRQVLGVNTFSVDPYQIGLENPEAIDSGAFWFYRKLGFRPVDPQIAKLVEREERRMRQTPGYRSSRTTLEKLAAGYILFEGPSAEAGAWDRFRIRNLALAATRAPGVESSGGLALALGLIPDLEHWTAKEKRAAEKILRAKEAGEEAQYLRLMQRHPRMRAAFLKLGSVTPSLAAP